MPHQPRPFFKANRNTWYVEVNRVQLALGKHPEGGPAPSKRNGVWNAPPEIMAAFYNVMASADNAVSVGQKTLPEAEGQQLVVHVFDEFLDWCQKHKAPLTYAWYRDRIQAFARTIKKQLAVAEFKPIHVERWVDAHPRWSLSHQRGCKVAIQRAFAWAEKMGVIDRNPVRYLEKPPQGKREQIITAAEHAQILDHFRDPAFCDLLEMAWHTGARPQETIRVEARHADLPNRRVVLPPQEAKGKKRFRVIYLNDAALELVRKLVVKFPTGPIFRNRKGAAWTAAAVNGRFCRLQQALGREHICQPLDPEKVKLFASKLQPTRIDKGSKVVKTEKELLREARKKLLARESAKYGMKYCLYAYRHSFANRLLEAGVDSLTVSALLGHVDGTMLARVYSHLQQNAGYLLAAVNRPLTAANALA
jgi:integrase